MHDSTMHGFTFFSRCLLKFSVHRRRRRAFLSCITSLVAQREASKNEDRVPVQKKGGKGRKKKKRWKRKRKKKKEKKRKRERVATLAEEPPITGWEVSIEGQSVLKRNFSVAWDNDYYYGTLSTQMDREGTTLFNESISVATSVFSVRNQPLEIPRKYLHTQLHNHRIRKPFSRNACVLSGVR